MELNRLLLKCLLSSHVVIQESYCKDIAKFNFLEIIWRVKCPGGFIFQAFSEPKIQCFFWGGRGGGGVHYKTPVLSYLKVGKYVVLKTAILACSQAWRSIVIHVHFVTKVLFFSCD